MAEKPLSRAEEVEVVYDANRWRLLKELRAEALKIMEDLDRAHLNPITHGSLARGDVSKNSDIDIFIPYVVPSFTVEMALQDAGILINKRVLIQATPRYALKGYIEIDRNRSISFPLVKLRPAERDFYKFGGEVTLKMLKENVRVAGVDKRLMLIEPTRDGHIESTIVDREEEVAYLLGVSLDIVSDRVRTLLRRERVGRTGVFIERELKPDETFEMILKRLADENPAVRRKIKYS